MGGSRTDPVEASFASSEEDRSRPLGDVRLECSTIGSQLNFFVSSFKVGKAFGTFRLLLFRRVSRVIFLLYLVLSGC